MNKLKNKIMSMNFKKFFARFMPIALIVIILGGIVTGIAFRTQISEVISYTCSEEARESEDAAENQDRVVSRQNKEGGRERHHEFFEDMSITKPSTGAKILLGAYGMLCFILFGIYWLTIAAWLYQSAVRTGFHGLLWFFLALGGNLFAVILFLLTRSFICLKCDHCGRWQNRKHKFCSECGESLFHSCPHCEAVYEKDAQYCSFCGKKRGINGSNS